MMKSQSAAVFGLATILCVVHLSMPASAQLSNVMQNMGSSSMPGISSLTGSALPSVGQASPTNLAGVIQYCAQNNYLSGSGSQASSVKDSLLSKFTGSTTPPSSDGGYSAGSSGVLDTGNGQTTRLGGTGMKAVLTKKLCGMVLSHAKSLL